jgi:hypothetical protein
MTDPRAPRSQPPGWACRPLASRQGEQQAFGFDGAGESARSLHDPGRGSSISGRQNTPPRPARQTPSTTATASIQAVVSLRPRQCARSRLAQDRQFQKPDVTNQRLTLRGLDFTSPFSGEGGSASFAVKGDDKSSQSKSACGARVQHWERRSLSAARHACAPLRSGNARAPLRHSWECAGEPHEPVEPQKDCGAPRVPLNGALPSVSGRPERPWATEQSGTRSPGRSHDFAARGKRSRGFRDLE